MWLWVVLSIIGVVLAGIVALALVAWWKRRNQLVAIVMLSEKVREFTEADVRGAARRAFGNDIEMKHLPSLGDNKAAGFAVMSSSHGVYFVISARIPYVEDPEADAANFENEQARNAFAAHKAWVAVDVGGKPPRRARELAITSMAKLAAEFLDESCTLLYAPALERVALPGSAVEAALRGPEPLSIFGDDEVNTPIFQVEKGEPKIERATALARKRWPEFVAIVERDGAKAEALVKGRFSEGDHTEFMWLQAKDVSAERVTGILVNSPGKLNNVKKGQEVTVEFAEVVDWMCMDTGKPKGGFVERVLLKG